MNFIAKFFWRSRTPPLKKKPQLLGTTCRKATVHFPLTRLLRGSSMGCCRGGRKSSTAISGPAFCKAIEHSGARFTVWPVVTRTGLKLAAVLPLNGRSTKVELLSFLSLQAGRCKGPTFTWLNTQLNFIRTAVEQKPQQFVPYASAGITLSSLVRLSREVLRSVPKVQSNSPV